MEIYNPLQNPSERLLDAKREFNRIMLDNDAFFAIIHEKLLNSNVNDTQYPLFSLEPTIERDDTNESTLGLRITKSREYNEQEFGIILKFDIYEYIKLVKLDRESGEYSRSPELKRLMSSVSLKAEDAVDIMQSWQKGGNVIAERMGNDFMIHPEFHTFELRSEIERTEQDI